MVAGIAAEPRNPKNRTWIVEAPFDIPPGPESYVEIMPFRGRNIFSGDEFKDSGAFQYYGHALDNIMADCVCERMSGVISWGQWRGWLPPPRKGGRMNNGHQPNFRNQFLRNSFVGTFSIPNYNYSESTSATVFLDRRFFATWPITNAPANQPVNSFLIFRGNSGGGGYNINEGTEDIIIEGGSLPSDSVLMCIYVG